MRRLLFVLPSLFLIATAQAAFECLPGPAPGGLGDWAWQRERSRLGVHGSVSLGRPAAIDGLSWSHATAGWRARRVGISGSLYSLGLDELYRENSAGLWIDFPPVGAGIRFWQSAWEDGTRRAGWTWEAEARRARGPFSIQFAIQGLPLGRDDPSSPAKRFSLGSDLRMGTGFVIGLAAIRAEGRSSSAGWLEWSPLPHLGLSETIRFPGSTAQSGIEFKTATLSVGLWLEPTAELGLRTGVRCAIR